MSPTKSSSAQPLLKVLRQSLLLLPTAEESSHNDRMVAVMLNCINYCVDLKRLILLE